MIEELLAYQEVEAKLKNIEKELSLSEERQQMLKSAKFLKSVEESVAKTETKSSDLFNAYENAVAKEEKLKEKAEEFSHAIESVEDETEATYLIKKADELFGQLKSLEEEISKMENEMKAVIKEFTGIVIKTKEETPKYKEYKEKFAQLKAGRAEEIESIEKELEKLRKKVDKDLMEKYDKKSQEKIFPVFIEAREGGKYCGYCGMEMPSATIATLKSGNIIECENCRRLLYLKTDK